MKKLRHFLLNRWTAFIHDLLWVPAALFLALWLRFNLGAIPATYVDSCGRLLSIALPIQAALFWLVGLYRGFWRFASIPDLLRIVRAVAAGIVLVTLADAVLYRLENIPRSVLVLYPVLLTLGLAGPRVVYRWFKDHRIPLHRQEGRRTLIVGAGAAGELLLRDLLKRPEYLPLAFVDDDPAKQGRDIHGIRVVGTLNDIGGIARQLAMETVLMAIPQAGGDLVRRVMLQCAEAGASCQILPPFLQENAESISAGLLKPVSIEDLLGRDMVRLDADAIGGFITGRCVLVTGGGGSIGSELCRQVAGLSPLRLVIFESSEFNLWRIEQEIKRKHPDLAATFILGDIAAREQVEGVFREYSPEVVFHAAAYKHVPMLEDNVAEGVANNVFGTRVVADTADRFGVGAFVMVSTDKAVHPTSVMGATKRIAELYCQNLASRSRTRFITTRFGNVLGSAGSVVPLFEQQIATGGPVTVTHPDITRFFMTISEAVGLILQAAAMGQGGEIFVLRMGEPVRIVDLAEQMIRLKGLAPGKDIEVVFTGLRPGEKLHEQLFHEGEVERATDHPKLMLAESRRVDWNTLIRQLQDLEVAAHSRNPETIRGAIRNIVPEFQGAAEKGKEVPSAA